MMPKVRVKVVMRKKNGNSSSNQIYNRLVIPDIYFIE